MRNKFFAFVGVLIAISMLLSSCAAPTPTAAPVEPTAEPVVATDVPAVAPTEAPTVAPTAEPVTIRYWHTMSDPETAQFQKVIDAFQAANPGITIAATRYAYNDFKTALTTAIAGGDVPDTVRMDIVWVSEFEIGRAHV